MGENIICFAKDWNEDPTSIHHVMRLLAEQNRVLWINSIATRSPNLTSRRDLGKIGKKLCSFTQGPVQAGENLWVYTPIVLPFPHSQLAVRLNQLILRRTIQRLRKQLRMEEFQLWTFLPTVADYVGRLGESLVVYYCTDEWSQFSYVNGPRMAAAENRLLERADVVFATARSLVENRRPKNPNTFLATHGVDFDQFSQALDPATPIPDDLAALPRPVLGFYGTIHDWIDFDLLAYLAERHPEWSFALIGQAHVDVSGLTRFPNVHFLGRKSHRELPRYCKGFAAGLIPYVLNERILHVNPIKLREYLCAGLPVVSTALPEVEMYRQLCHIGDSRESFERGIAQALQSDTPELRRERSEAMRAETWHRKVADIGETVSRIKAAKQRKPEQEARVALEAK
jgi:glycosyltransferase involved in cell wall biosynthesis